MTLIYRKRPSFRFVSQEAYESTANVSFFELVYYILIVTSKWGTIAMQLIRTTDPPQAEYLKAKYHTAKPAVLLI